MQETRRNVQEDFRECSRIFTPSPNNVGPILCPFNFTFGSSKISLLFTLWYSTVFISALKSSMLPWKRRAISMNWELYQNDNLCVYGIYLFSLDFRNLRDFALIFCLKHFNSNRSFDSSFEEFNEIAGNLDNFLTREKQLHLRFLTDYWIHFSGVNCMQKYSFWKAAFLKGFPKFVEKFP